MKSSFLNLPYNARHSKTSHNYEYISYFLQREAIWLIPLHDYNWNSFSSPLFIMSQYVNVLVLLYTCILCMTFLVFVCQMYLSHTIYQKRWCKYTHTLHMSFLITSLGSFFSLNCFIFPYILSLILTAVVSSISHGGNYCIDTRWTKSIGTLGLFNCVVLEYIAASK